MVGRRRPRASVPALPLSRDAPSLTRATADVVGLGSDLVGRAAGATEGSERVLVEVKGYPSDVHLRGPKAGLPKTNAAPTQARSYFSNALLSGLLMRSEHPAGRIVLAFPDVPTFASLAGRIALPLHDAGVECWLVDEAGAIRRCDPLEPRTGTPG